MFANIQKVGNQIETKHVTHVAIPTSTPITNNDSSKVNWKTYTNSKYLYTLQYPSNLPVTTNNSEDKIVLSKAGSVIFGCGLNPIGACDPPLRISIYPLTDQLTNTIFKLNIGNQTNRETTYAIGGEWNQKTNYTRLPDQIIDGLSFLALDNPNGYGGSNKLWYLKMSSGYFSFNCVYSNQNDLNVCQEVISSFRLTNVTSTPDSSSKKISCQTNADCQKGYTCTVWGPVKVSGPQNKYCTAPGQVVPL